MKFNLSSRFYAHCNRLTASIENESLYEAPEVSEPIFWAVFLLVLAVAAVLAPFRRRLN